MHQRMHKRTLNATKPPTTTTMMATLSINQLGEAIFEFVGFPAGMIIRLVVFVVLVVLVVEGCVTEGCVVEAFAAVEAVIV